MHVRINIWQLFDAIENVQSKVRADFFSVCFVPRTIRIAFHGLAGIPICFFGNLMEIFFPERKKSSTENLLTSRTIPVFATNGFTTTGSGIEFHSSFASSPLSDLVTLKSDKSSVFTDKSFSQFYVGLRFYITFSVIHVLHQSPETLLPRYLTRHYNVNMLKFQPSNS